MNTCIRRNLIVVAVFAALGAGSAIAAGNSDVMREFNERRNAAKGQPQTEQPAPAPSQNSRQDRQGSAPPAAAAPRLRGSESGNGNRGNERSARDDNGGSGSDARRTYRTVDQRRNRDDRNNRDDRSDRRDDYRGDRSASRGGNDYRGDYRRQPRIVPRLPAGYRHYNWNGRPYYNYRGSWYRPYGGTYISIGVPYGLFVTSLAGGYSSFWFGNTRYYHADDTYYLYEPARRGYVVTRSPYGDERDDSDADDVRDEDLFIYPARGQSEQQQADDRYECHRWAANETGYDPIDDTYDGDDRADYLRAMTACLTGRGYSVR
jgi:hypothetical protein